MAAGHVITSGGGLQAGDLTGINNVRADQTWTYPTTVGTTITNTNNFSATDIMFSNAGVDVGRILAGNSLWDPSGNFIGRSSMSSWNNMWANGIIGLASPTSSGASDIIRRETRNGALLSNTSFSYNYTGYRYWSLIRDIDPVTGNIVFGFWQSYSSASGNFNILAFNWSGAKIADFVISNPPVVTGLAITSGSIYFAALNSSEWNSGGYVSRYRFSGTVEWSRTDIPTYIHNGGSYGTLANSGGGPSGSLSASFDGSTVYVIKKAYYGGGVKPGEICALSAADGSRVGGGRVALSGDYVRFTSKERDNTFCMSATPRDAVSGNGSTVVARFNKNAELLELSPAVNLGSNVPMLRANEKVVWLQSGNNTLFTTYMQYPTVPSQWQILE